MQEDGSFNQDECRRVFWEAQERAYPKHLEQARRIADALAKAVQDVINCGVDESIEHNVETNECLGQMVASILQRERKLETVLTWRHVWKHWSTPKCLKCRADYGASKPGCQLIVSVKPFWKFEIKE